MNKRSILVLGIIALILISFSLGTAQKSALKTAPQVPADKIGAVKGPTVTGEKDYCYLTHADWQAPGYYYWQFFKYGDKVAIYFDPDNCDLPVNYPFQLHDVALWIFDPMGVGWVDLRFSVEVMCQDICYGPGIEIWKSEIYGIPLNPEDVTLVEYYLDLDTVCLDKPFFFNIELLSDYPEGYMPSLVFDQDQFVDTCYQWYWPGQPRWYEWYEYFYMLGYNQPGWAVVEISGWVGDQAECGWWYWKPDTTEAPSGMPDFDQNQPGWLCYCGPTAVANCLWWFNAVPPGWTPPQLIDTLARYFHTNPSWGTYVDTMQMGLDQYFADYGFALKETTYWMPDFYEMEDSLKKCQDIILLLGFWWYEEEWQEFIRGDVNEDGLINIQDYVACVNGPPFSCDDAADVNDDGVLDNLDCDYLDDYLFSAGPPPPPPFPDCGLDPTPDALGCADFPPCPGGGGGWYREGGHFVTMAGVNSEKKEIAISDPDRDRVVQYPWWPGRVRTADHLPWGAYGPTYHNNTQYVSHDVYISLLYPEFPSPGSEVWDLADYCYEAYKYSNMNVPERFRAFTKEAPKHYEYWHVEVDAAVMICRPKPPADTLRNHFKTWRIEPEPFSEIVFVQDQFMSDTLILDAIEFFSNPVRKDTFEIVDSLEHLTWYRAHGRDTLLEVEYSNQFGTDTVCIDSVKYLLLPTAKEDYVIPESLDHYKAYRIKDPVTFDRMLVLEDQFDRLYDTVEFIDSLKPIYFLTPALKNKPPPMFDSITHYVAYEIIPKHFYGPLPVFTFDQFGDHFLQVDTSKILLVPTRKLWVEPPPNDPPEIIQPDTLYGYKVCDTVVYQFSGADPDNDPILDDASLAIEPSCGTYSVSRLTGHGTSSGTWEVTWDTKGCQDSVTYRIIVDLTDAQGNTSWCTTYCHLDPNHPPVIDQPDFLEGYVDDVVQYTITGTDPDGDVILDSASIDIQPGCGDYSITRISGHGSDSGTWEIRWFTDGCTPCDTHLVIHDLTDGCDTSYCTTYVHLSEMVDTLWYWKPDTTNALSGMPDFDQYQFGPPDSLGMCGPTAVANCLWWFNAVPDGTTPDDLIRLLSDYFNTDPQYGTYVDSIQIGLDRYFEDFGFALQETTYWMPDFYEMEDSLKVCQDIILLIGFWWSPDGYEWYREGGHFVTMAGVCSESLKIAISDPAYDRAVEGWPGRVRPPTHPPAGTYPPTLHNNPLYVSHDMYQSILDPPFPSPGNPFWEIDYPWAKGEFSGINVPERFRAVTEPAPEGGKQIFATEVEAAIMICPKPEEPRECDDNDPKECDTLWVECGNMRVPPGGGLVTVDMTIANDESLMAIVVPLSYQGNPECCDSLPEDENTVDKVFAGSIVPGTWVKVISIDHQAKTVILGAVAIMHPSDCLPPGKGHLGTLTLFGDSCCTIQLDTTTWSGPTQDHVGFMDCHDPTQTLFYPVCRIDTCHIDRNNPPEIGQPDFLEGYVDSVVEYDITGTDPDGDNIEDEASIVIIPGCGSGYSITRTTGHGTSSGTWSVTWYTDGCTPCDTHMVIHDLTDVLGATSYCTTWVHLSPKPSDSLWYWKPDTTNALSGMPDFDQYQFGPPDSLGMCGPTAVANCLWWFNAVPGGTTPDDLIRLLSDYFNTDPQYGTYVDSIQIGLDRYFEDFGFALQETTYWMPDFYEMEDSLKVCQDIILLIGFWYWDGYEWYREGGHFVTMAGVCSESLKIAISDPAYDRAVEGWPGRVRPPTHPPAGTYPPTLHNNPLYVSHDMYQSILDPPFPSPGNPFWEIDYPWAKGEFSGMNVPERFRAVTKPAPEGGKQIFATEVEAAIMICPKEEEEWPNHKMHYPQLPDPNGWDIVATMGYELHPGIVVADDFMCTRTRAITDIHFWGSWLWDIEAPIFGFFLSIHENIPAPPYSMPGEELWSAYITDFEVVLEGEGEQGWFDPWEYFVDPFNHQMYYRYDITFIEEPFYQDSGTIYWLNIMADIGPPGYQGFPEPPLWGWKTSLQHWEDDAVWSVWMPPVYEWIPLYDPMTGETLDMAFVITGPEVLCGDVNNDGIIELGDIVYLINFVFRAGPAPVPYTCVGDVNNDNAVELGDIVYLINFVFRAGPPPDPYCCTPPWKAE